MSISTNFIYLFLFWFAINIINLINLYKTQRIYILIGIFSFLINP